ncbi:MAG TPA: hybrid sensor histidine kinase/response regulator transcription factor [Ktedonobacteraceae bacterium]
MASQTLLNLIARLQQGMEVAQGRALLLDYARRSCGARLALLFELEHERHLLILLAHSGRHPHPSSFAPEAAAVEIPLQGLFASVLKHWGLREIPDISREPLALPEERAFAWPRGRVLLHSLRQGQRQGVLVFCFSPAGARSVPGAQAQEELLICTSLLSAYLSKAEASHPGRPHPARQARPGRQMQRSARAARTRSGREPAADSPLHVESLLQVLTALCELGLVTGAQGEKQELYEQMLHLLCAALRTPAGFLWRYYPEVQALLPQASWGEQQAPTPALTNELNRRAGLSLSTRAGTACGLIVLPESAERVLAWQLLRYRDRLLGALGLFFPQKRAPGELQWLLLSAACDMMALLLLHLEWRRSEQQASVQQERARIVRELHDSVVQDMAHVVQKLDYIQRIGEQQPAVALNEIEQARTIVSRSLRDLRSGIASLVPLPLEEQAFDEALKSLLHEYRLSMPHLQISADIQRLALWPQALRAPVYRFMQEALNNIRKHASASQASIRIRQAGGFGIVQVSDNGQGFVPEQVRSAAHRGGHLGLASMQERVRQAGGVLTIHSRPGEGTTLKARFPLTRSSAILTEREREVLHLLVDGLTNRAISERLSVSLETVKSHVHHIMQKMHVKDRTQAAVLATRQQWL